MQNQCLGAIRPATQHSQPERFLNTDYLQTQVKVRSALRARSIVSLMARLLGVVCSASFQTMLEFTNLIFSSLSSRCSVSGGYDSMGE